jgi:hypothetical protein
MAHSDDSELAPADIQLDMFEGPPPASYADGAGVRGEIADVLGKVRAAPSEPWEASDIAHLRNIFSRMAERLPSDEAAQLRVELETELTRLMSA